MLLSALPTGAPDPASWAALTDAEREQVRASLERRARANREEQGYRRPR
jgi:predicted Fe-S protein YdhL (DUF1289 family)